jgi:exodeoxyribonuclease VII large subunit
MQEILTVSELTSQIKFVLEEGFSAVIVEGEISNFKAHVSGHWYFNLKDANAVISCTMWKGLNNYVFFTPQDGMKVHASGRITVYPPRGNYQLDVRSLKPAGIGDLQAAFEKLKQKLAAEGLFDIEHKRTIPEFPKKIGIITAIDGAALKDMISVAKRRFPLIELIIIPTKVQGSGAAEDIVDSIRTLNRHPELDFIILGRGGGSIEDLWAFNEEIVARAIYNSKYPIITGIGHEIDFTIADFVADLRAPTPSAAMEIATPDKDEYFAFINDFIYNSYQDIMNLIGNFQNRIYKSIDSYGFKIPIDLIRRNAQSLDNQIYRLTQNMDKIILRNNNRLTLISNKIEAHDINKPLKKGFVLVKQNSNYVQRVENFNLDKAAQLTFFDGAIEVEVKN